MAEVTYTAEDLNNYTKKQLNGMFLEKESMSKSISDLTSEIHKLNDELQKQLISTERQSWANAHYHVVNV